MNSGCIYIQQTSSSFVRRARLRHSGWSSERAHQGAWWAGIPENGQWRLRQPGGQVLNVFNLVNGVSKRSHLAANLEDFTQNPRLKS